MTDVNLAASSFLMYRTIVQENLSFSDRLQPRFFLPPSSRIPVRTIGDIDRAIRAVLNKTEGKPVAVALSGGIDSAIIAKYLPKGSLAYTFRCVAPGAIDETQRAREHAESCGLQHKVIDMTWQDYLAFAPVLMERKGMPIHSIEPQIYKAALTAKADGAEHLIFGESADEIFGGMDKLLSKDWTFDEFVNRYAYVMPESVLKNGVRLLSPFEKYRKGGGIDVYGFLTDYFYRESNGSYNNACAAAGIGYVAPYVHMVLDTPLDLARIRAGEPKYLLQELYRKLYGVSGVPGKVPMPRAVAQWLQDWGGPERREFLPNCVDGLTGDQKWMVFILEVFLNQLDARFAEHEERRYHA